MYNGPLAKLEQIDLPDAEISFCAQAIGPEAAQGFFDALRDETRWHAESVRLFGRTVPQPRLTAWHADEGVDYAYSGIRLVRAPWTTTLQTLRESVERSTGERFNGVLLNLYRDQDDSIGMHSDDERSLGPAPAIATLSLGATRTMVLKHRFRHDLARVPLDLPAGSLLLMRGPTQRCWRHGISKTRKPAGPRISLTFRWLNRPAGAEPA
jgi:alkylated DNA repair dioxygenase AlkB